DGEVPDCRGHQDDRAPTATLHLRAVAVRQPHRYHYVELCGCVLGVIVVVGELPGDHDARRSDDEADVQITRAADELVNGPRNGQVQGRDHDADASTGM